VAICPSQLGQIGALWGMQNLSAWVAGERAEILSRKAALEAGFHALPDWTLLGCGAYFAYVQHPFDIASDALCKRFVHEASVLMLPGTMFQPAGSVDGKRQIRIAFANVDATGIAELFHRLTRFRV
jgi:aspartate/methionine/tyrosine aminotransferase